MSQVGSGAQTGRHLAAGTGAGAERAADPRRFRDGRRGRRCGGGEDARRLGDLNTEVAHTDAEVRQTLGVVEEARVGVVASHKVPMFDGRMVCPLIRNQSWVSHGLEAPSLLDERSSCPRASAAGPAPAGSA